MGRRNIIRKEVAFKDGTTAIEKLPYPIVYYPGLYGAFFAFKEKKNSELTLCSCSKKAVKNYIKIRHLKEIPEYADPSREFLLDSMYFPIELVNKLMKMKLKSDREIFERLRFKPKLCHECNKAIPSFKYCHEMYGAAFKQNFGWYINKQYFDYGIHSLSGDSIDIKRPEEIQEPLAISNKWREKALKIQEKWCQTHEYSYVPDHVAKKEWKQVGNYSEKVPKTLL